MIIDAFAFCRQGEKRAGKLKLSELPRLRAECVSDEGDLEWMLIGEMSMLANHGYPALRLTINGAVQLKCQRCLAPYEFQIQSDSNMLLAKDEAMADQMDAMLMDGEAGDSVDSAEVIEVIVGSPSFDVLALIEDEALLALPLAPKHDVCPNKVQMNVAPDEKKPSPFAILQGVVKKSKK